MSKDIDDFLYSSSDEEKRDVDDEEEEEGEDDENGGRDLDQSFVPPPPSQQQQGQQQGREGVEFTSEGIRTMKETKELYRSNFFKLSFQEILKQIGINYERMKPVEAFMKKLYQDLKNFKGFPHPLPKPRPFSNTLKEMGMSSSLLSFEKKNNKNPISIGQPLPVRVIGSYLLRSLISLHRNIDIGVGIPHEMMGEKNMNVQEYLSVRNYFLQLLRDHLVKNCKYDDSKIGIEYFCNDFRKPILVISQLHQGFVIRIFPMKMKISEVEEEENYVIFEDQFFHIHLELFHESFKTSPMLIESIMLLKLWFRQKNLSSIFNGFQITRMVYFLFKSDVIKKTMSSYQIFKLFLSWVVKYDFSTKKKRMTDEEEEDELENDEEEEEEDFFKLRGCPVFSRNRTMDFEQLQYEARRSLLVLNTKYTSQNLDIIHNIFLSRHHVFQTYDLLFTVKLSLGKNAYEKVVEEGKRIETLLSHPLVKKDRMVYVRFEGQTLFTKRSNLLFGVVLKPSADINNSNNKYVMGPVIQEVDKTGSPEMVEFVNFWGKEHVSIKNTSTGVISQVFTIPNTSTSTRIESFMNIIRHVLHRHKKIRPEKQVIFHLEKTIFRDYLDHHHHHSHNNIEIEKDFQEVRNLFVSSFGGDQAKITFPGLEVLSVNIHSPSYRNTKMSESKDELFKEVYCVTLEFRKNRHWPLGNTEAVSKLKSYIYLEIHKKMSLMLSQEEEEEEKKISFGKSVVYEKYVDVHHRNGGVFRLIVLIEQDPVNSNLLYLPHMTRFITGFTQYFPHFGYLCRFLSRWLDAHLFTEHVSHDVVELLVALVYDRITVHEFSRTSPFPLVFRLFRLISELEVGKCYYISQKCMRSSKDDENEEEEYEEFEEEGAPSLEELELISQKGCVTLYPSFLRHFISTSSGMGRMIRDGRLFVLSGMVLGRLKHYSLDMMQVIQDWVKEEESNFPNIKPSRFWERLYKTSFVSFDLILRIPIIQFLKSIQERSGKDDGEEERTIIGSVHPFTVCVRSLRDRLRSMGMVFVRSTSYRYFPDSKYYVIGIVWYPKSFFSTSEKMNDNIRWEGKIPIIFSNPKEEATTTTTTTTRLVPNIFEWIERIKNCFPCKIWIHFNEDKSRVTFQRKKKRKRK